jgi:hypothetical protein
MSNVQTYQIAVNLKLALSMTSTRLAEKQAAFLLRRSMTVFTGLLPCFTGVHIRP